MNGIMCGSNGNFMREAYCASDEVCTGTTKEINAVVKSNKAVLCTKGKFACYDQINFKTKSNN